MIKSFNHVSFTVSNLDKAIDFYTKVLEGQVVDVSGREEDFSSKVTGIHGAKLQVGYIKIADIFIELIEYLSPSEGRIETKTSMVGSSHVCFWVEEMDKLLDILRDAGGKVTSDPQIIPDGPNAGRSVVYTKDPDGNNLEFISFKRTKYSPNITDVK